MVAVGRVDPARERSCPRCALAEYNNYSCKRRADREDPFRVYPLLGAMRIRLFAMFALCVGHAASLTLAAGRPNLAAARVHRSALRMQEEIPSKFVRSQWGPAVSVTLPKPLGLKLVEGSAGVVRVEEIVPRALRAGALRSRPG